MTGFDRVRNGVGAAGNLAKRLAMLEVQAEQITARNAARPIIQRQYLEDSVAHLTNETARLILDREDAFEVDHAKQVALARVREVETPNDEPAPLEPTPLELEKREKALEVYRSQVEMSEAEHDRELQRQWSEHRENVNARLRKFRAEKMLEGADPSKLPKDLPEKRHPEWNVQDGVVRKIPYAPLTAPVTSVTQLGERGFKTERTIEIDGDVFGRRVTAEIPLTPAEVFGDA